jgi:hypothetical protein
MYEARSFIELRAFVVSSKMEQAGYISKSTLKSAVRKGAVVSFNVR